MSKIQDVAKLAGILRGATIAAMVALPIAIIGGLLATPLTPELYMDTVAASPETSTAQLIAVVALNLISPFILLLTLNEMRILFEAYQRGEVLTDRSAKLIQRIGQGFLALAIIPFVLRPIQSVLLTWNNPPGGRSLAIGLDSDMLFFALSGGLIIVIGWAMREASVVASENKAFV
ncbi:hypothetical protein [Yoonia sp. BS5-3]|uniref:DUF2975 domain-containing protein n=1 Tax=Yoonia phaeophyticola TaxID=3137369 RepID=A0ABZ2V7V4_9RHOB